MKLKKTGQASIFQRNLKDYLSENSPEINDETFIFRKNPCLLEPIKTPLDAKKRGLQNADKTKG